MRTSRPRWSSKPSCPNARTWSCRVSPRARTPGETARSCGRRQYPSRFRGAGFYGCDVNRAEDVRSVRRLVCEECGRVSPENERGWTAYLTTDEDEPAEAVVYCPACAANEFGLSGRRPNPARRHTTATLRRSAHVLQGGPRLLQPRPSVTPFAQGSIRCRPSSSSRTQRTARRWRSR